jgi:hypothetical protein
LLGGDSVTVHADIEVSGEDGSAEFGGLWEWLRQERSLTGSVQARPKAAADGELGGAYEVLSVALGYPVLHDEPGPDAGRRIR